MLPNLISLTAPTSAAAEAYRSLRVNLLAAGRAAPLQTILVAAVTADPDKAATVANLAVAFAKAGKRTVLADCDLRNPAQHSIFGLSNAAGAATALRAGSGPRAGGLLLQETAVPGLRVLTGGPQTDASPDLLASPAMSSLIGQLRAEADVVLVDAPPVLAATDAAELATQVDGVLLLVRAGHTKRDEAQRAQELLKKVGARLVGAALVNVA